MSRGKCLAPLVRDSEDFKYLSFLNFKNPIYILNQGVLMLHTSHRYKIHSIYMF